MEFVDEQAFQSEGGEIYFPTQDIPDHFETALLLAELCGDETRVFAELSLHVVYRRVEGHFRHQFAQRGKYPILDEGILEDKLEQASAYFYFHGIYAHLYHLLPSRFVLY
jgi:hypothetical protein